MQVHAHSASIDHPWQALAFPWWQRWLFGRGAALSRRPPRKPAEATARNLQRVLLLTGAGSPQRAVSGGSSDSGRGDAGQTLDEGGHWGAGLLTGGRRRKSVLGDASSVRFRRHRLRPAQHACARPRRRQGSRAAQHSALACLTSWVQGGACMLLCDPHNPRAPLYLYLYLCTG